MKEETRPESRASTCSDISVSSDVVSNPDESEEHQRNISAYYQSLALQHAKLTSASAPKKSLSFSISSLLDSGLKNKTKDEDRSDRKTSGSEDESEPPVSENGSVVRVPALHRSPSADAA